MIMTEQNHSKYSIWIPGKPFGKGRHRTRIVRPGSTRKHMVGDDLSRPAPARSRPAFATMYADPTTKLNEDRIETIFQALYPGCKPFDGPVSLEIVAVFVPPKATTAKDLAAMQRQYLFPTKKPDIDNIVKIILDGLQGYAFVDDKQVIEIATIKAYYNYEGIFAHVTHIVGDQLTDQASASRQVLGLVMCQRAFVEGISPESGGASYSGWSYQSAESMADEVRTQPEGKQEELEAILDQQPPVGEEDGQEAGEESKEGE